MISHTKCPICRGSPRRLFAKEGFDILECPSCGHQLAEIPDPAAHVGQVYGNSYFFGGGAGYPDYTAEGDVLRAAGRRYGRLLAKYTEPGRLLDVGAAAGYVLKGLEDCGWEGVGLEPNARMARHAEEVLGLRMVIGLLEVVDFDEIFDVVSIFQVIGHVVDPRIALKNAARFLVPGGYMLIDCWNRQSLTARVFGQNWHEYSPPSVLHWFSVDGLRRLGEGIGLIHVAHGRPLKILTSAHAKALFRHKFSSSSLGNVTAKAIDFLPDRMPIVYPFDDLVWMLFRKA